MALYHARSPYIVQPSFMIMSLDAPVTVVGMDDHQMGMKYLILLLSPADASEQALEILSFLSSLLIESEENIAAFQSNDEAKILDLLTKRFDQYFKQKIKELWSV
jgi:mannitol operon transcriptional antiterminator